MGPGGEKGRSGRRRGMGVESGRSAFPGGHANRRFVSCPGTPGGGSPPTVSRRCTGAEALEDGEQNKLDEGQIENLVASLHALERSHPGLAEIVQREANYFEQNKERMRYPEFRKRGFFVGSGVIEAGCKTAVGRLKQSGMFWTVRGANAIIALRCCHLSAKFEDYWDARRVRA